MACHSPVSANFDGPLRRLYHARSGGTGYVLDVQVNPLQDLNTRVVVPPLPPKDAPKPARGLNPAFQIDRRPHLMLTQVIAMVPAKELMQPVISLDAHSDDIMRALDMLVTGFEMGRTSTAPQLSSL